MRNPGKYKYVLITPARNEEAYIEKTIQAVISQTILPKKWIIVSDGSTDRTNEIVLEYQSRYKFLELVYVREDRGWNIGSKVKAIKAGYTRLHGTDYDFIGNLDADITFGSDYYERVLSKFSENAKLGIAGGMISELYKGKFEMLNYNLNSVAGAVQFFDRRCYEQIGGYLPMKYGGIDAVAEIMARMYCWETRSFKDIIAYHHRRIGMTIENVFYYKWRCGLRDYSFGTHPIFMVLKSLDRLREKPYFISGMLMLCGYMWEWIRKEKIAVPDEVASYVKKEQVYRIIKSLRLKRRESVCTGSSPKNIPQKD